MKHGMTFSIPWFLVGTSIFPRRIHHYEVEARISMSCINLIKQKRN